MYSNVLYSITNVLRSRCLHFNDCDVHSHREIETLAVFKPPHVGLVIPCWFASTCMFRTEHAGIMSVFVSKIKKRT